MAENDIVEQLLSRSRAMRERIETTVFELENMVKQLQKDIEYHNNIEKSAEAFSVDSARPYLARPISDALAGVARLLTPANQPVAVSQNGSQLPLLPLTPKITKSGVLLKIIESNPGLKSREIHEKADALDEKDRPMEITIDDVYRALPRLIRRYGVRRDEHGKYFAPGHKQGSEART